MAGKRKNAIYYYFFYLARLICANERMVSKMKKDTNVFGLFVREMVLYAAGIIIAAGSIIGILYGANLIAEFLSGFITVEMGLLTLFTIAGVALYIDFRPEKKKAHGHRGKHGGCEVHPAVNPSSNRMLKAYSVK